MEKKLYSFSVSDDGGKEKVIHVLEADLSKEQKGLILGELIKQYSECPDSVKAEFLVWALKQPEEIKC